MNKTILVTLVSFFIVFTMAACTETKKETEPVEIHFQGNFEKSGDPQPLEESYIAAIENFNRLNPTIRVVLDYMPSKISIIELLEESNRLPDIVPLNVGELEEADEKELLIDLQQFADSENVDIHNKILDIAMVDGKLLALPYGIFPNVVFYNKEVLDKSHIPYPQKDWTWEQFRDISGKINSAYGSIIAYDFYTFDLLMTSSGNRMLSADGNSFVGYLDSPEAIRTLEWLNAYYRDDRQKSSSLSSSEGYLQFNSNNAGMILGSMGDRFEGVAADQLGVAPFPHFEGSTRNNPVGISQMGITSKSKHPQEAWEFIEYLTFSENESSIKLANGYVPTSASVLKAAGYHSDTNKNIYSSELEYAVKYTWANSPLFFEAWSGELAALFEELLAVENIEIPKKLHELALKLDQKLSGLKLMQDQ